MSDSPKMMRASYPARALVKVGNAQRCPVCRTFMAPINHRSKNGKWHFTGKFKCPDCGCEKLVLLEVKH